MTIAYNILARHYDTLMKDVPYSRWVDFISLRAQKCRRNERVTIVDAGCGTGTVAIGLARKGYDVVGVDGSSEMLAAANFKSERAGVAVKWMHQDFSRLNYKTDMVVCTCDGVNHLLTARAVVRFFKRCYSVLNTGGYLIFDINSPYKFQHILANNIFAWQIPNLDITWINEFAPPYNCAKLLLYSKQGALYRKSYVEIIECCHRPATLLYYLRGCGFVNISLWDNYLGRLRHKSAQRITIVAQK